MAKLDVKVIILAPHGDIEHVKRLKLPYEITSYLPPNINENNTLLIRWGTGWEPSQGRELKNHLVHFENIALNCNKFKAAKKLGEVVNTPKLYEKEVKAKKLIVLRPFHHSKGENFKVVKGPFKVPYGYYAKEFINSDRELRVWYAGNKTICAKRVTQNKKRLDEQFKCRSKWNYKFWKKTPKNLHKQVLKAAKHMNIPFGAFDIIYKNRKWYFLENNTAIAVDHSKIVKLFNSQIKKMVNNKIKKVKIDYRKNPPFESKFKVVNFDLSEEKSNIPLMPKTNGIIRRFVPLFKPIYNYFHNSV